MRQTRTRILSLLLALVMCLSLLPMTAMAATGEPTLFLDPEQIADGMYYGWVGEGNSTSNAPTPSPGDILGEITFNLNGAGENQTVSVKYGDTEITPPEDPTLPGYRFLGWYICIGEVNGRRTYAPFKNCSFAGGIPTEPFYAIWEKETPEETAVRVNFLPNGGRITEFKGKTVPAPNGGYPFTVDDVTGVDMNSGIGWTNTEVSGLLNDLPTVEREGYTFDGWYFTGTGPQSNLAWDGKLTDFSTLTRFDQGQKIGVLTELAAKWVKATGTCTVTFEYVNGPGTPPDPVQVPKGAAFTLPKLEKKGYNLVYWMTGTMENNTLTGRIFEDGTPITADTTLYAIWEVIPTAEDTYNFSNDDAAFENYKITQTYFDFLTESTSWKEDIKSEYYFDPKTETEIKWGGSCFGMSAVYCMAKGGAIDLSVFQSGVTTLRALKTPRQSQNIQDLINFYMMAQSTTAGVKGKNYYLNMDIPERYRKIVSDLTSISVLGFNYSAGGHAIVARSVEQGSDGYHIEIWDPNNPEGLGELVISPNFSSAYFTDETYGANAYNKNTVIKYIMPLTTRSETYDAKNLQSVFGKAVSSSTQSSNSGLYLLSSSTGDFTVTATDGRSAVVKGGKQVSGNLKLLDGSIDGGPGDSYRFYIEASDLDHVAITLDGKQSRVKFVSDTFMTTVAADTLSSVVVDGSSVTTTCATPSQQEITVVSDSLGSAWNKATVSGKDTGFTLAVESGQLKVGSKSNVSVSVQGENVDTWEASGKQTVIAAPSGTAVAMSSLGTGAQQPSGANPFTDVKSGAYYYDAVLWAVEKNVTSGTSATKFSPDASCTRGQIVTFLWRAAGSPKPSSTQNPFTDVKSGTYYYDAVLWAVEKGITSGTSATTFSPDASCTRGQTVTFLWRAAGSPKAVSNANPFTDVKSGTYYYDAVLWAVEQKITSGTSATTFSPDATVTRGQTVTFLYRSQGK